MWHAKFYHIVYVAGFWQFGLQICFFVQTFWFVFCRFAPDFTMSRIRQTLMLQTSLGVAPLNFTLQATIPANALSLCAATLPRPAWEPLLYYAAVLSMGFLLFGVMVASYFEADRISVADIIRRRAEMSHAATVFEKGRMFDLRSISRSGLSHGVCDGDAMLNNGSATPPFGLLASNSGQRSQPNASNTTTNGHVPLSKMMSSGDGQRSGHSALRFLERIWASRSQAASQSKSPAAEVSVWTANRNSRQSVNGPSHHRWNLAWLGVASVGSFLRQVRSLATKLARSSVTAVSTKSTSTGEDNSPADTWPESRRSALSNCESAPCRDDNDEDYLMVLPKPDTKSVLLRREKSATDQLSSVASSEPQSKTGLIR